MRVTFNIWQNSTNSEWNCEITTSTPSGNVTSHWAVEDFCELLNLVNEKIPGSKFFFNNKPTEEIICTHIYEPIPETYDLSRMTYRMRCIKCQFIPE